MDFFSKFTDGLSQSRDKFKESMNVLLKRGPQLDEDFWEELEDALVLSDVGGATSFDIVEELRSQATRQALPDSYAVLDLLEKQMVSSFATGGEEILNGGPAVVIFVGVNGTGKTTSVGKIAYEAKKNGRHPIMGSADTFRAAAIEQLQVWADRADVQIVSRERGSDPASVCYETIEKAEQNDCDLVLIDTAGRLHTSDDLMRELQKVVGVVRKRANCDVFVVLVLDATTGQNGMQQAREFQRALDLDGLLITKLDGTAKGGISLAISHELDLPIIKIGVGESIEDLQDFNPEAFVKALIGNYEDDDVFIEDRSEGEPALSEQDDANEPVQDGDASYHLENMASKEGTSEDATHGVVTSEDRQTQDESLEQEGQPRKMTWAQFVEEDEKRKMSSQKHHFWERW